MVCQGSNQCVSGLWLDVLSFSSLTWPGSMNEWVNEWTGSNGNKTEIRTQVVAICGPMRYQLAHGGTLLCYQKVYMTPRGLALVKLKWLTFLCLVLHVYMSSTDNRNVAYSGLCNKMELIKKKGSTVGWTSNSHLSTVIDEITCHWQVICLQWEIN